MADRRKEILNVFKDDDDVGKIIRPMVEDVVFLEERLEKLRELPFIKVNPENKSQQKVTPAAKQYKELLQQYNNCIKIMCSLLMKAGVEDASPLKAYLEGLSKK